MVIETKSVPAKESIKEVIGIDVKAGDVLKVILNDKLVQGKEFTVPEGKKGSIRIEIRGMITDAS